MKYLYNNIIEEGLAIDKLVVQSFGMSIYLVELVIDGNKGLVYGDNGYPKRFRNTQDIRIAFEGCEVAEAELIQDSPYDEMIGNPEKAAQPLIVPFSLKQAF